MKKIQAVVLVFVISLIYLFTIGLSVYFIRNLQGIRNDFESEVSDLKTLSNNRFNNIKQLESAIKEAEEELEKDLDGDGQIGDDEENDSEEDICLHTSTDEEFIVTEPCENDVLGESFDISGRGRVFEATFSVRVKDSDGNELYDGSHMTEGGYKEELDAFEDTVSWTPPTSSGTGTIEFYVLSAEDGSEELLVSFPISY
jgi:hypothetical protein